MKKCEVALCHTAGAMSPCERLSTVALLLTITSTAAFGSEPVEVFVDKGDVFIRAGSNAGVQKGDQVTILGDLIATTTERRRAGTAVVMEVWPTIARVSLDEAARAVSGKKMAVLEREGPPAAPAAPAPAPNAPAPPPPPPTARPSGLLGHATFRGAGPWKLLQLTNDGPFAWNNCRLGLPGALYYSLAQLKAGDHEAVALSNFVREGKERDVPITNVKVTCVEGVATFVFPID